MKNPIPYTYDLNTKSAQKVICVTHTDDNSVDVIQLHVVQGGALIDFSGNTITARMVMSRTHELLSDNVVCTIDEATKDVMIPIDRKAVPTRKGLMLIEVNVCGVLPEELTLQFPLLVRVNGSILDDAEITPESQGTIPELLIAAAEELERVQGFITADDVYDILDSTLQGAQNVTPSLYVKIKGDNYALVYEDSNDVLHELFDFSNLPSGTSDYTSLENKPSINGHTLSGNKTSADLDLQGKLTAGHGVNITDNNAISAGLRIDYTEGFWNIVAEKGVRFVDLGNGSGTIGIDGEAVINSVGYLNDDPTDIDLIVGFQNSRNLFNFLPTTQNGVCFKLTNIWTEYASIELREPNYIFFPSSGDKIYLRTDHYENDTLVTGQWQEIGGGSQIVSGVVNQNGTITFTDSDGNTFTTTGSSVIGADGVGIADVHIDGGGDLIIETTDGHMENVGHVVGADGQDYVLTAQDKSDIADIVLSELPTTQGVLYGNTSN